MLFLRYRLVPLIKNNSLLATGLGVFVYMCCSYLFFSGETGFMLNRPCLLGPTFDQGKPQGCVYIVLHCGINDGGVAVPALTHPCLELGLPLLSWQQSSFST